MEYKGSYLVFYGNSLMITSIRPTRTIELQKKIYQNT